MWKRDTSGCLGWGRGCNTSWSCAREGGRLSRVHTPSWAALHHHSLLIHGTKAALSVLEIFKNGKNCGRALWPWEPQNWLWKEGSKAQSLVLSVSNVVDLQMNLNGMKNITQEGSDVIWYCCSGVSNSMVSISTTDLLLKITELYRLEESAWYQTNMNWKRLPRSQLGFEYVHRWRLHSLICHSKVAQCNYTTPVDKHIHVYPCRHSLVSDFSAASIARVCGPHWSWKELKGHESKENVIVFYL